MKNCSKRVVVTSLLGCCHQGVWVIFLASLLLFTQQLSAAPGSDLLLAEPVRVIEGGIHLGLRHPSNVAMTSDNRILVLDGVSNRVVTYSYEGKFLSSFGKGGNGEAELSYPLGMCIDAKDNIYIADSGNARVQIYNREGKHLQQIKLPQSKTQKKPDPTDVVVDNPRQLLYVVDNENHQVLIYDLQAKAFTRTIGGMSHKEDGFRWPFSLYIDQQGVVYVVDVINTRVRTILPEEDFKLGGDIGSWGVEKGELFRPKGVAVNAKGQIFIADSYLGVIQMFDPKGKFLAVLSDDKGKVKRFTTPTRLYFDRNGLFYVVEMFANRISVYRVKS
jgi:sugar lactone lactonase YvrE